MSEIFTDDITNLHELHKGDVIYEVRRSIVHIYEVIDVLKDNESVDCSLTSHTFTYKNYVIKLVDVRKLEPIPLFHI
ncbi:MAG: hypothetical protein QXO37_08695 [Candidatus Nitrosocaldaceae archaeon]